MDLWVLSYQCADGRDQSDVFSAKEKAKEFLSQMCGSERVKETYDNGPRVAGTMRYGYNGDFTYRYLIAVKRLSYLEVENWGAK